MSSQDKFIKHIEKSDYQVEMIVDWKIFSVNNVLKASYELVDKVYMFFKSQWDDYLVQFKLKDDKLNLDQIVNSFWEELVYHKLRYDIDQKSWDLRKKIIETALWFGVSLDDIQSDIMKFADEYTQQQAYTQEVESQSPQKSIDQIITDIENDPDFADDKDEIISILKEIEQEQTK